jgi:ethanolamine ammonia-lyase small subunit
MNEKKNSLTPPDSWATLKKFTDARIALGRTGNSLPTHELLRFQLAHAQARDAVQIELDVPLLAEKLKRLSPEVLTLQSAARTKQEYLQRPDFGRRLGEPSIAMLQSHRQKPVDISIVVADGLSALAVERQAFSLLEIALPKFQAATFSLAPLAVVTHGRVAIGDEIASLLDASLVVVLIGERPGLSSPDSLGLYLTYQPRLSLTDESRNCISNIRPEGLGYKDAAEKLFYLASEALRQKRSGVLLKDLMMTEDRQLKK